MTTGFYNLNNREWMELFCRRQKMQGQQTCELWIVEEDKQIGMPPGRLFVGYLLNKLLYLLPGCYSYGQRKSIPTVAIVA